MVAIMPYVSTAELYLYYLVDHRPQQGTIGIYLNTGQNHLEGAPSSPLDLPDAIQAPALIAAATRHNAFGDGQPQQSLFYVWRSKNMTTYDGEQGSVVLNMTNAPPNEESWVQNSLTVTNLGWCMVMAKLF